MAVLVVVYVFLFLFFLFFAGRFLAVIVAQVLLLLLVLCCTITGFCPLLVFDLAVVLVVLVGGRMANGGACCDAIRESFLFFFIFLFFRLVSVVLAVGVRGAVLICISEKMRSRRAAFSSLIHFKSPLKSAIVLLRFVTTARRSDWPDD